MAPRGHKAANKWVARIIPVILLALIGYSAYVITKVIAIDYLLNPSPDEFVKPRPGSAIAVLVFYYLLLLPVLICYARLIQIITTNPGYVPRGAAWHEQRREDTTREQRHTRGHHSSRRPSSRLTEKPAQPLPTWPQSASHNPESGGSNHSSLLTTSKEYTSHHHHLRTPNHLEDNEPPFWHHDIFTCNPDGRPPFCSTCLTHKPDRTHHCSEVDRCVRKMDHFCPWVGGIVSETSFKFFIQFLVYAALFCIMVLTTIAVFVAERKRIDPGFLNLHYYLILGISAMFTLFTVGMAGSSIQLALANSTTVENLSRRSKVWFLAVLIPRLPDGRLPAPPSATANGPRLQTITYPRPIEEENFLIQQARGQDPAMPPPLPPPMPIPPATPTRTFAILSTKPGENPFDLGPWRNIREVMGYSIADWILPVKQSPCADHRRGVSAFRMKGGLIRRLKEEAGLVEVRRRSEGRRSRSSSDAGGSASARKKRRRRRSEGGREKVVR
jgi:palmitoyltransferase